MPKRLGMLLLGESSQKLEEMCKAGGLNEYETEIIIRIYNKRQNLSFISDTMYFNKYGKKEQYSVRTINNIHREAFKKLIFKENNKG